MNVIKNKYNPILHDFVIIFLSILIAVAMVKTNFLLNVLTSAKEMELLGSFLAGVFFTSIFTIVPAAVILAEIAHNNSLLLTAFFGAMGTVVGDLVIFRFVKDSLSEHLLELLKHQGAIKRLKVLLRLKYFRWLTFLIGGLVIASPLPDEIGISILGLVRTNVFLFALVSFTANFTSILLLGSVAKIF